MIDLMELMRNRAEFFHNPDYVRAGFPGHLIEPLAAELIAVADEIERLTLRLKRCGIQYDKYAARIEKLEGAISGGIPSEMIAALEEDKDNA